MKRLLLLALLLLCAAPATAQEPASQTPPAAPADVESLDAILAALYDVISGPVDEPRDWDRMRSLFIPGARLIPTGRTQQGEVRHQVMTVEDYVTRVGPRLEQMGFSEHEIAREVDRFGSVAQVFSTYEGRTAAQPDQPLRGINSIQALYDGQRWWIVTVFWQAETETERIPEEYR